MQSPWLASSGNEPVGREKGMRVVGPGEVACGCSFCERSARHPASHPMQPRHLGFTTVAESLDPVDRVWMDVCAWCGHGERSET